MNLRRRDIVRVAYKKQIYTIKTEMKTIEVISCRIMGDQVRKLKILHFEFALKSS